MEGRETRGADEARLNELRTENAQLGETLGKLTAALRHEKEITAALRVKVAETAKPRGDNSNVLVVWACWRAVVVVTAAVLALLAACSRS
jgi:hypothetical protein